MRWYNVIIVNDLVYCKNGFVARTIVFGPGQTNETILVLFLEMIVKGLSFSKILISGSRSSLLGPGLLVFGYS